MSRLIIAYHIIHSSLYQYYTNNQTLQCSGRFQNIWENTCRHVSTWCHPPHLPNCLELPKPLKTHPKQPPKKVGKANKLATLHIFVCRLPCCYGLWNNPLVDETIPTELSSVIPYIPYNTAVLVFLPRFRAVVKHLSVVVRMAVRCYAPASESS